jgi:hypothetical protein
MNRTQEPGASPAERPAALPPEPECVVSRYFFHVMDGRVSIDQDGTDLEGIDQVRREAVRAAGEILANGEAPGMLEGHPWNMTVADESGTTILTLRFKMEVYG